ncbi:MAG: hypothetical protein CML02_11645 [Pseudooceanicola sp.]|jgi:hypothetical protein|nr:hypothetical protein [Pseudooceanicola sp.]
MRDTLIVTTTPENLMPLGSPAQRSFDLVTGVVADRIGADHAALFAEPVVDARGTSIDWHAPRPGQAMPLSDLASEEAAEVKLRLSDMVARILAEAQALREIGGADQLRLAEALENAIEVPGQDQVYVMRSPDGGLDPVLVHWAWLRQTRAPVRGVLSAMVPRASVPGAASVDAQQGTHPGLWWLLGLGWLALALMLAAIWWLSLAPCGLRLSGPNACAPDPAEIAAAETDHRIAADAVAALEREIALANRQCHPVVPLTPAAAPEDKTELPQPLRRFARIGRPPQEAAHIFRADLPLPGVKVMVMHNQVDQGASRGPGIGVSR